MAFPLIGAALAIVAPIVKDVVMDAVKDVAMDIGKSFVDTIGKGIKDIAGEVLGKGAKAIGDLIKNPVQSLMNMGKHFLPPGWQIAMQLGKPLMQTAMNMLQKLFEKLNINVNINIGGANGGSNMAVASGAPSGMSVMQHDGLANQGVSAQSGASHGGQILQAHLNEQNATSGTQSAGNTQSTGGTSSSGDAGKTDDKKAENYTNAHAKDFAAGNMSGADMERLQLKDPKAFSAMMKDMTAEDRGLAMQQMQQHLQQVNQMISMMTNMLQIQHDTTKAVINNLRV